MSSSFKKFFIASLSSSLGSNLFLFTQGWYLLEVTNQKMSVGLSWSLFFLPGLFLFPMYGRLLDNISLSKFLSNIELSKILLLVSFLILINFADVQVTVYLMSLLYGGLVSAYFPSLYVAIRKIVSSEHSKYNHTVEVALQLSNISTLLVSGVLYEAIGFKGIIGLSVFLIMFSYSKLRKLKIDNEITQSMSAVELLKDSYRDLLGTFKSGIREKDIPLRKFFYGLIHTVPHGIIMASNVPIILYVYHSMKGGMVELSIMDGLFGLGGLIASLFWMKNHRKGDSGKVLYLTSALVTVALIVFVSLPVTGVFPYLGLLVYGMISVSSKVLARATVIQELPVDQPGRYSSLYQLTGNIIMMTLFFIITFLGESVRVESLFLFLALANVIYLVLTSVVRRITKQNQIQMERNYANTCN